MQSAFNTLSCGLRRRCSGEGRQATGFIRRIPASANINNSSLRGSNAKAQTTARRDGSPSDGSRIGNRSRLGPSSHSRASPGCSIPIFHLPSAIFVLLPRSPSCCCRMPKTPFGNRPFKKACTPGGNGHDGARLTRALLIINSSGRLSGEIGIVETEQQAERLLNRSGIKQYRLPQGRGLAWKLGFPGGTGLQSRSIFFRRSVHQHKTTRCEEQSYSTSGRHGAANPSGLAASGTMIGR
jgi:hypothetical protein